MKNLMSISICLFLFVSCQNDELLYSCLPDLDNYVKNNIESVSKLSLTELSARNEDFQRAAYRSYTPEKKFDIWFEKLSFLLQRNVWTIEEYQHIQKLIDELNVTWFDSTAESQNNIQAYVEPWIQYAKEELKWDQQKLSFVVASLFTSEKEYRDYNSDLRATSIQPYSATEHSCNCNNSDSFCSGGSSCESYSCSATTSGCGFFWQAPCDGACIF